MRRYIVAGLVLAVLTTLLVVLSDALGLDTEGVALLGGALGGALGLVPDRSPAQRAGAFVIGFLAAWLGYALRAAVFPDATAGRAIAVLIVLLVCLAVGAATRGKLPLWATLLGAAAMAGAYETTYAADPTAFISSSAATATSILVAAGAGFVATSLLGPQVERERELERAQARHVETAPAAEPQAERETANAMSAETPATGTPRVERPAESRRPGIAPYLPLQPRPEA
ncbi:hypothetical protein [Cellulomonas rhizosphaerae]|uniref:Uncharacterized protein n=1 Tax=Cellulomonas rhizosphaerae TaxID=2293719 RepID=A0A413RJ63_9CELL|nr:hypothetical protein [Cellulomonas rhizosphaerae]RHA38527.1 hypothetical protein D1825_13835 [Cellulomonas rhizosphaerae]